ncbi:MAG: PEP-CTERM sorting domain-containing protein [Chthonomonas sp.]|nr:PEP-CTERM sorting domain-containing protein [Chthonomonas sp.]
MRKALFCSVFVSALASQSFAYFQDFQAGGALPEWSSVSYLDGNSVTRAGVRTLGRFADNASTTLTLTGLSAGAYTLSFRLYTIGSWDGQGPLAGPDIFGVKQDGVTFFQETFNNVSTNGGSVPYEPYTSQGQSFGGQGAPVGTYLARTGMTGFNGLDLGQFSWDVDAKDTYYDLTFNLNLSSSTLALNFFGNNLQDATDESWSLDNVRVTAVPEPGSLAALAAGALLLARKRRA